jgi:hypothetical protein
MTILQWANIAGKFVSMGSDFVLGFFDRGMTSSTVLSDDLFGLSIIDI